MAGLTESPVRKERLDRFLFFSRAVKSRTLAQKLIEAGSVRVNAERTVRTDLKVGAGDVLTMALHGRVLVWRILDLRRPPRPRQRGAGALRGHFPTCATPARTLPL